MKLEAEKEKLKKEQAEKERMEQMQKMSVDLKSLR
jgi:hypothetical protein|tara:strand:- start:414 stop:518 length:105 start_codon:yes stop_codon:yes gene_type:complete